MLRDCRYDRFMEDRFMEAKPIGNGMKPVHIEKINANGFLERKVWTGGESSIPKGFKVVKPKGSR